MLRRCLVVMLWFLLPTAVETLAQTEYEDIRRPALRLLGAQLHAGLQDLARDSLRTYLVAHPGDALMRYNLACLVALTGDTAGALEQLDRAVDSGFRKLNQPSNDPDLAMLHGDVRLIRRMRAAKNAKVQLMQERWFTLVEGEWSEPVDLWSEPADAPGQPSGSVRIRYDAEGLDFELEPPPGTTEDIWLTVVLPRSLEDFASRRWREYRLRPGRDTQLTLIGQGNVRRTGQKLGRVNDSDVPWRWHLPWSSQHPNRPPVELVLGFNVTLRADEAAPARRWQLIPDPFVGSPREDERVFVPVSLDPGWAPAPLLAGRLDRYLAVGDTVSVEFGIQGLPGGEARFRLRASAGQTTERTQRLERVDPDLAFVTIPYDLAGLPHGWFELSAEVTAPDGRRLSWSDRGFRLSPDWFVERQPRLEEIPDAEQAILQHRLFRVLRGQQQIRSDESPVDLVADMAAADVLLERFDRSGSLLPVEPGQFEAAFPRGRDALHPCWLVLPESAQRQGQEVVIVAVESEEDGEALARALADARPVDDARTMLVVAATYSGGDIRSAAGTILNAASWAQALFQPRASHLVGIAAGAEPSLRAVALAPDAWASLKLIPRGDFDPWPLGAILTTVRMLALTLGELPIMLAMPEAAAPRAAALARELAARAARVELTSASELSSPTDLALTILAGEN